MIPLIEQFITPNFIGKCMLILPFVGLHVFALYHLMERNIKHTLYLLTSFAVIIGYVLLAIHLTEM